jgi:outer membrane protein OmpA-like peptidoglycan-associated protein
MKSEYNNNGKSRTTRFFSRKHLNSIAISALILTGNLVNLSGQTPAYTKPSWWFGAAAGANFNFYNGSTQKLNEDVTVPVPFKSGSGIGLFAAPLVEFHIPDSRWGLMLQAGFDSRRGSFKEILAPCNCPRDLSTNLSYISIEPGVRFAPFKSDLYFFGGPRIAINTSAAFTYIQKTNPDFPDQIPEPDIKGNLSDMNKLQVSMQIGAGYDIPLNSQAHKTQYVLSPFISFQPYFGQSPRSIETWNITTLRAGIAFKLGCGTLIANTPIFQNPVEKPVVKKLVTEDPKVNVYINAPKNIPVTRKVREVFPLRNYVYFTPGSDEIPTRYVLLKKEQVKDFKEDQAALFAPSNPSGRSPRQMTVYYNVLNILGDRMIKDPSARITLVGSSEQGPADGRAMAESIRKYLVNVFGIKSSRISIEGRDKPKIPSEQPGGTKELDLLREGDRRVSIESSAPSLLMEFQTGPDAPLKPVEVTDVEEAPVESYVTFNIGEGKDSFASWSLEITDKNGTMQHFGPYTQEKVSIPGKSILGTQPSGDYKIAVIGKSVSGKTVENDTTVHLVLWTPPVNEEVTRFSILYEFNDSKAIAMYEKYITEVIIPKIPNGAKVIIHGYTDIIGDATYNQKLSLERAADVRHIMEHALAGKGRTDVSFEIFGFGEDQNLSMFKNDFPEERSYNRTVIIDIIPQK